VGHLRQGGREDPRPRSARQPPARRGGEATGENNYTRYEFRELIERRAARYLMPDVCRANGYSETLKIGHLAAAHHVAVSPHVVYELSIQVCGALSNGFLVELMDWMPPDLFEDIPRCVDGQIRIPERPGHGMVLAREGRWRSTGARRGRRNARVARHRPRKGFR
jgi:L-alanine-DL-glutamate epimerase-like enolase superfamily enzyme